jgi:hypothetical protein
VGGLLFAWLFGEGLIVYRWTKHGAPPPPGTLLAASGLFVGCAVLAEYPPARFAATAFAWAVDVAVLMQLLGKAPNVTTGWPPPMINDPSVILPSGKAAAAAGTRPATRKPKSSTVYPTPTGAPPPGQLPGASG